MQKQANNRNERNLTLTTQQLQPIHTFYAYHHLLVANKLYFYITTLITIHSGYKRFAYHSFLQYLIS